ncbi:hypothetical protein MKZ38_007049 [Zalerion maritima]|uniref:Uncharacterized protein n=1 Tax=Zalerion maritima TaxID=339359 RepID=A0AAD5RW99_9PEZI|nr:hypothetical protein MKZ38_007049 [Zalerion maritima]
MNPTLVLRGEHDLAPLINTSKPYMRPAWERDKSWTPAYIILAFVIPVFIAVCLISIWLDRRDRRKFPRGIGVDQTIWRHIHLGKPFNEFKSVDAAERGAIGVTRQAGPSGGPTPHVGRAETTSTQATFSHRERVGGYGGLGPRPGDGDWQEHIEKVRKAGRNLTSSHRPTHDRRQEDTDSLSRGSKGSHYSDGRDKHHKKRDERQRGDKSSDRHHRGKRHRREKSVDRQHADDSTKVSAAHRGAKPSRRR